MNDASVSSSFKSLVVGDDNVPLPITVAFCWSTCKSKLKFDVISAKIACKLVEQVEYFWLLKDD